MMTDASEPVYVGQSSWEQWETVAVAVILSVLDDEDAVWRAQVDALCGVGLGIGIRIVIAVGAGAASRIPATVDGVAAVEGGLGRVGESSPEEVCGVGGGSSGDGEHDGSVSRQGGGG